MEVSVLYTLLLPQHVETCTLCSFAVLSLTKHRGNNYVKIVNTKRDTTVDHINFTVNVCVFFTDYTLESPLVSLFVCILSNLPQNETGRYTLCLRLVIQHTNVTLVCSPRRESSGRDVSNVKKQSNHIVLWITWDRHEEEVQRIVIDCQSLSRHVLQIIDSRYCVVLFSCSFSVVSFNELYSCCSFTRMKICQENSRKETKCYEVISGRLRVSRWKSLPVSSFNDTVKTKVY